MSRSPERARADEGNGVVCGVCGRSFPSEDALDRHVHDAGLLY